MCTHIESNQLLCPGKFCKHYAYLSLIFYLPFNSCSVYRLRWVISIHLSSLINSQNYQWSVNQSNYLLHEDAITVRNDYRCSNLVYNGLLLMSLPLCYFARGFISPLCAIIFSVLSAFWVSLFLFLVSSCYASIFFSLSFPLFIFFRLLFLWTWPCPFPWQVSPWASLDTSNTQNIPDPAKEDEPFPTTRGQLPRPACPFRYSFPHAVTPRRTMLESELENLWRAVISPEVLQHPRLCCNSGIRLRWYNISHRHRVTEG